MRYPIFQRSNPTCCVRMKTVEMNRHLLLITTLIVSMSNQGLAQSPGSSEPGSEDAIAAATTESRFLSPWVSYVPGHRDVPSPTAHLGHIVGAPGELTRTESIYAYYRALAAASDRVKVDVIGRTEEGRDILLVIVGDAASLRQLDQTRSAMTALADPRRTDEAAMERIIAETTPFYMLHGGLHSTETGSPEMLMELAYRLAVSDAPHIKKTRDALVVLINPVAEPDGRDRAVDWFYRHLKGNTDFDRLPPRSPPYWGKYVFHDNNRDGIQRKLGSDPGNTGCVPQMAPPGGSRSARVDPPPFDLDGNRAVQREPRPHYDHRMARDGFPRGHDPDLVRHAGRLDLGVW